MRKFLVLGAMVGVASVALVVTATAGGSNGANVYGVGGGWTGFAPGEHVAHFGFSAHEGAQTATTGRCTGTWKIRSCRST